MKRLRTLALGALYRGAVCAVLRLGASRAFLWYISIALGGSDTTSEGQPEPPNPPNTLDNPEERDQGETTSSPKEVSTELTSKDRTVCKTKQVRF